MGKLIEIFSCSRCRNTQTIDCFTHYCGLTAKQKGMWGKKITTNYFTEIPDWCPLDDAPDKNCDHYHMEMWVCVYCGHMPDD